MSFGYISTITTKGLREVSVHNRYSFHGWEPDEGGLDLVETIEAEYNGKKIRSKKLLEAYGQQAWEEVTDRDLSDYFSEEQSEKADFEAHRRKEEGI